jgi:glycosyltransferase involved in cell wall biosynthesis
MPYAARSSAGRSDSAVDVLVLAPYPEACVPSQRFRFEQYLDRLRDEGIRLHVSSFLTSAIMPSLHRPGRRPAKVGAVMRGAGRRARDLASARRYDAVLVHREAMPLGPPWVERMLGRLGVPYVFDLDDAIYLTNWSQANRRVSALKFPAKTAVIARQASLVVAGNADLAAWARGHAARVEVIPTTIDTSLYVPRPQPSGQRGPVCIGWSGSVTTSGYLDALAPILCELQREYGVRLRVIGDESYRTPGADIEAIPWRQASELDDLRAIDIGVMPLPDDEWARGKCGLKALQYMALGIPTVMSPVGVNRRIAQDDAARLAGTPAEWKRTLTELINDAGMRVSLGLRGRDRVQRDYSTDAVAPLWAQALRSVVAADHRPQRVRVVHG